MSNLTFPIFGHLSLSQHVEMRDQANAAFEIFASRHKPAAGNSAPYLTGRYVTLGAYGGDDGEIVTLAQVEWVEGGLGPAPDMGVCAHGWIDLSDGSFAGDSLDEILETMSEW